MSGSPSSRSPTCWDFLSQTVINYYVLYALFSFSWIVLWSQVLTKSVLRAHYGTYGFKLWGFSDFIIPCGGMSNPATSTVLFAKLNANANDNDVRSFVIFILKFVELLQ